MREDGIIKGYWCSICQDRINAIGNLAHIVLEYYSLKAKIELRKFNVKHETPIEEGTRPDLIIKCNDIFKNEIAFRFEVLSFLNLPINYLDEIAILHDFKKI